MPGREELDAHAATEVDGAIVAERLEQRQRAERVGLGEERLGRLVLGVAVPVGLLRVFFLDPAGVGQHQAAQLERARRAVDAALVAGGDEARQEPGVIEVRVRQDDRVERLRDRRGTRSS